MTKEEFKGFSSAAQHDMVLEALVRITKNLETMEKESGKPFAGTSKQRRNDIKLLTILAEAFSKNELIWDYARVYKNSHASKSTMDDGKYASDPVAAIQGIRDFKDYMDKSKPQPLNPIESVMDAKNKIENARQKAGKFMSPEEDEKPNTGRSRDVVNGIRGISDARMAKRRSK